MTDIDVKNLRELAARGGPIHPNEVLAILDRLEAAERERDEARALKVPPTERVDDLERQEKFYMAGLERRAATAERDTAERIAAFCDRMGWDHTADLIRAGEWRQPR